MFRMPSAGWAEHCSDVQNFGGGSVGRGRQDVDAGVDGQAAAVAA